MNTRSLPTSRIHRAVDMIKEYDVDWAGNLSDYAQGEYLIHGKLEHSPGLWQAVEFKDLITAGFWKAFPTIRDTSRQHLLFQRVLQLRIPYFRHVWEAKDYHITTLKGLAECFGDKWEGIVMTALITIRSRDLSDVGMQAIESSLSSMKLPQLPWSTSLCLRSFHTTLGHVPEAQQFMQLLRMLYDRQQARDREKEAMVVKVEVQEVVEGAEAEL